MTIRYCSLFEYVRRQPTTMKQEDLRCSSQTFDQFKSAFSTAPLVCLRTLLEYDTHRRIFKLEI